MKRNYHSGSKVALGMTGDSDCELTEAGSASLDLLRLGALTALVLYHVACLYDGAGGGTFAHGALIIFQMGYVGTDVLLAMAGFLTVGSLARAGNAPTYLIRRYLRVFPALAIFLVTYLYGLPALLADHMAALPNFENLQHAREIQWGFWSLTANFQMVFGSRMGAALEPMLTLGVGAQLTVLAVVLASNRRRLILGTVGVFIIGVALRIYWLPSNEYVPYSFPLSRGDGFFFGAAFASLSRSASYRDRLLARRFWLLGASTAALAILVVMQKGLTVTSPGTKLIGYPLVGAWSASLVLVTASLNRCPKFLRRISPIAGTGFCVYLVKLPVVFLVSVGLSRWARLDLFTFAMVALFASFALGMAFHFGLERPLVARLGFARKPQ